MARLFALVAALLAAGCGGASSPSPAPAGMTEALPALILRGATIRNTVSGDPGCPDSELHSNAMRVEMTVAGDPTPYAVYLFRWRRDEHFTAAEPEFNDCVDQFVAEAQGEVPVDVVEASLWRAYGPGWSEEVLFLVDDALEDLAGGAAGASSEPRPSKQAQAAGVPQLGQNLTPAAISVPQFAQA